MGFRSRKNNENKPVQQALPGPQKTLGHTNAIRFASLIMEQQWAEADRLFSSQRLVDQAHMVSVASDIGGSPAHLNPWIDAGTGSGVAELMRGAMSIVAAWDMRSGASSESVQAEIIDKFHLLLQAAETDLHAAADLMPESSIPWQHLLTSGRGLHVNRATMDDRYVKHIERGELLSGHMSFQQLISKKWAGSHEEMWEHAEWITGAAPSGSVNPVLIAIALIEHHIKSDLRYDSIRQLPDMLGKAEIIGEAAHKSYADPSFDSSTPEGAMALSAWFTLHYLMGNWDLAADLMPAIGDRFARFPMVYFQDASWPELQQYVNGRLVRAA